MAGAPTGADFPRMELSQVGLPGRAVFPEVLPRVGFRGRVGSPVVDSPVRFREGRGAFLDRLLPEVSRGRFLVLLVVPVGRLQMAREVFRGRPLAEGSRVASPVVLRMGHFPEVRVVSRVMALPVGRAGSPAVLPLERCQGGERDSPVEPPVGPGPEQARGDFPARLLLARCPAMPWPRVGDPWVGLRGAWRDGWDRWEPLAECREECLGERG